METQSGIYCITFLPTQQKYIGSTTKFRKRFAEHRNELKRNEHHSWKLQKLWNKSQNENDLAFIVLEIVENHERLMEREQFWLDIIKPDLNTIEKAHRLKPESIVRPWLGKHRPEDTRKKISESLLGRKGHPMSNETREKIRIANTGKKHSDETRRRLSESHKDLIVSAETRAKQSAMRKGKPGKPVSEETKVKLRTIAQAQWRDPKYKAKHHKAVKKAMRDPEVLRRLSESHKGKELTKEHRQKIGDAHRGTKRSKATRKRQSEARKLWWAKRKGLASNSKR